MRTLLPQLPQDASNPEDRAKRIAETRAGYTYDYNWPPEVAMPEEIKKSDQWTPRYIVDAVKVNVAVIDNGVAANIIAAGEEGLAEVKEVFNRRIPADELDEHFFKASQFLSRKSSKERPASLEDYENYYGVFHAPALTQHLNAHPEDRDRMFAYQRVAGANPMVISAVSELPDHFPVDESHYAAAMGAAALGEGDSLAAALAEGRAFLADYALLDGAEAGQTDGRQKYMTAPLALFAVGAGARDLMPVAIQCTQTPGADSPIYTPRDNWRWRTAQHFVQIADANIHEAIEHLGCTHLVMGALTMAMRRQLAAEHPIRVLIEPHVHLTFAINNNARSGLVSKGGTVDKIMAGTIEATLGALKAGMDRFSLMDSAPELALARRGVLDADRLPIFPYREDVIPVWRSIHAFVTAYLGLYYDGDAAVAADAELAAWVAEMGASDGGRLKGMRPIQTVEDLITLVTNAIFTGSAQHAAVNFPQYPFMGDVRNMPGAAWGPPPGADEPDTEAAFFARMPPWDMTTMAADTVWQLCDIRISKLGGYGLGDFTDPRLIPLIKQFKDTLKVVEAESEARDGARVLSYPYLRPSQIPASIHI